MCQIYSKIFTMHSTIFLLLAFFATIYVAVSKPVESLDSDLESQALYSLEAAAKSSVSAGPNIGSATSSSNASASVESEALKQYQQMFRFVYDQDITSEEDFEIMLLQLENLIEEQYYVAMQQLKRWYTVDELAEHKKEAEIGLSIAKERLLQNIRKAANTFRSCIDELDENSENYQELIQEHRQEFNVQIQDSLEYYINALNSINSLDLEFESQNKSEYPRTKKLVARSVDSEVIEVDTDRLVDSEDGMLNSITGMGQDTATSALNQGANYAAQMVDKTSTYAGSLAISSVQTGTGMMNPDSKVGDDSYVGRMTDGAIGLLQSSLGMGQNSENYAGQQGANYGGQMIGESKGSTPYSNSQMGEGMSNMSGGYGKDAYGGAEMQQAGSGKGQYTGSSASNKGNSYGGRMNNNTTAYPDSAPYSNSQRGTGMPNMSSGYGQDSYGGAGMQQAGLGMGQGGFNQEASYGGGMSNNAGNYPSSTPQSGSQMGDGMSNMYNGYGNNEYEMSSSMGGGGGTGSYNGQGGQSIKNNPNYPSKQDTTGAVPNQSETDSLLKSYASAQIKSNSNY